MKHWIDRAIALLEHGLFPMPQELNELDWKESLSPSNEKLSRHLCAFANLSGGGFIVFGIRDESGLVIGVDQFQVSLIISKLTSLGRDMVEPSIRIDHAVKIFKSKPILIVHVFESQIKPVHLKAGTVEDAFIRSGGTTRKVSRQELGSLLLNSRTLQFEELSCSPVKPDHEVLDLIDYRSLFGLIGKPVPQNQGDILRLLTEEKIIQKVDGAGFFITTFGALAAAHDLHDFDVLSRKAVRVIRYHGLSKQHTEREFPDPRGFAIGFKGLIGLVSALLPSGERFKNGLRTEITEYPAVAIREVIANALIHQDFMIRGSGPMIEIFDDRIEVSNPGTLLPSKKLDRLIRTIPESRNEILASAFRRYNICEERGSGLEKAVAAIEMNGLPPLKFLEAENSFRVVIYGQRKFAKMSPEERIEAAYQHSVIRYFSGASMNNASLRERFQMHEKQRPQVSLVIKEALSSGKIKPKDPRRRSSKFAEYIPYFG